MRLLYVCSDFGIKPDGTKGASVHLRAITRGIADAGHKVWLLSPHRGPGPGHPARDLFDEPGSDHDGAETHQASPVEKTCKKLKRWMTARGYGDAVARELRPLLFNATVCDRALTALAGVKPDAIVERLSLFGHVGLDIAQALRVPLVLEVNALLAEEARRFRSLQMCGLASEMEQRVLSSADAIMPVSTPLAQRMAEMGIDRQKVHVIPNGVALEPFDKAPSRETCRRRLGLDNAFVVGFVGSLKVWHGVDVLLAAFGRLYKEEPSARLLIVGTGPMEDSLQDAARSMGIEESVTFTGAVPHERVPEMLGAMDVAVAPFRQMEGFYFSPIKLFEYMASGTSVIASRLGQISRVIEDGASGLLCEPDDVADLHTKLQRVRQSVDLRERLANRASRIVRQHYTWGHTADKTCEVIRRAVENRRETSPLMLPETICVPTSTGVMR